MPLPKKAQPAAPPAAKPRKLAKAAAPKAATKPAPAPAPTSGAKTRAAQMPPLDPTGTSDLAIAMRELLIGGETRQDVMRRVAELLAQQTTRGGKPKPVSTIINHALNRALAHGYRVKAYWVLEKDPKYKAPSDEIDVVVTETPRGIQIEVTTPAVDDHEPRKVIKKLPKRPATTPLVVKATKPAPARTKPKS